MIPRSSSKRPGRPKGASGVRKRPSSSRSTTRRPKSAGRPSRGAGTGRGVPVTHSCGHVQKHPKPRARWQADRNKEFLATRPCTACWQAQQAEEAEALCGIPGLPRLKGTPSQILWARTLRGRVLSSLKAQAAHLDRIRLAEGLPSVSEEFLEMALPSALEQTQASWWIDHREEGASLHLFLDMRELQRVEEMNRFEPCPF